MAQLRPWNWNHFDVRIIPDDKDYQQCYLKLLGIGESNFTIKKYPRNSRTSDKEESNCIYVTCIKNKKQKPIFIYLYYKAGRPILNRVFVTEFRYSFSKLPSGTYLIDLYDSNFSVSNKELYTKFSKSNEAIHNTKEDSGKFSSEYNLLSKMIQEIIKEMDLIKDKTAQGIVQDTLMTYQRKLQQLQYQIDNDIEESFFDRLNAYTKLYQFKGRWNNESEDELIRFFNYINYQSSRVGNTTLVISEEGLLANKLSNKPIPPEEIEKYLKNTRLKKPLEIFRILNVFDNSTDKINIKKKVEM